MWMSYMAISRLEWKYTEKSIPVILQSDWYIFDMRHDGIFSTEIDLFTDGLTRYKQNFVQHLVEEISN